ncbi:GNAT family N-acetyltransferase [Streptomyces sp. NPDC086554]|uniref:GNAT family N-acetyltransferase n=1 Tax=Streptomyces sp. NPDC086554 TaxID=3154864 RepID=UPI00343F5B2A
MIPHASHQPPSPVQVFPSGTPGAGALAEHVLTTGHGQWWTDRIERPRVVAVASGGHALLAGDPTAVTAAELAPLAGHFIEAADRFLPVPGAAFDQLVPWPRMLYVHRSEGTEPRIPRGVTVRPLTADDVPALAALDLSMAWIHATWGGPAALASSGLARAAFRKDRVIAVACSRFVGSRYEDVACATAPGERRQHLALACVEGVTADIAARGRTATWSCSRDNRPSRLLAWTAGYRLDREYVHHAAGPAARTSGLPAAA